MFCLIVTALSLLPMRTFAEAPPTSLPMSTATMTAEPSPTPPKTGKCCWCMVPEDGEYSDAESRRLREYCELCLMDPTQNPKAVGCDTSFNSAASRFESDLHLMKSRGECSKEVYVANNQHGPIFSTVAGLVSVCVKTFPTCSIEVDDRSCQSFRNEQEAQIFLTSLQSQLGNDGSVTVCGNSSSDFTLTCARLAANKRYIVSKYKFSEEVMRCNREGRVCDPVGDSWQCLDFGKKLITQTCCGDPSVANEFGLWVNNAQCKGEKVCPERCRNRLGGRGSTRSCTSPTQSRIEVCEKLPGGGFICSNHTRQCRLFEHCQDGVCVDDFAAPFATPTASATSAPKTREKRALQRSDTAKTTRRINSLSAVKGVPHHFTANPATLKEAFTPQLFFGSSQTAEFEGIHGTTGVAIIKVDPVSTIGMLRFVVGDVIHYVNDKPIRTERDIFDALTQSRARTFITYSRTAPKEQADTTSNLPKPKRWNWVITIHAEDSNPGSPSVRE